jgi:polyisoprenoid-binding protein YceI
MTRRTKILLGAGAGVIVLAGLLFAGWYFFIRDDAPPPVAIEDAVASVETTVPPTSAPEESETPATTSAPATTAPATTAPPTTAPPADGVTGTWTVDTTVDSFVGYRVQEELARIGATEAVGRTPGVSGVLVIDGTTITEVVVKADMTQLESDSSRRDGFLRDRSLETNAFPTAGFVLTEPVELDGVPEEGEPVSVIAKGELTLHGVTREVEIPIDAQVTGERIAVVGSTDVLFADYDIEAPSAAVVLSVDDNGVVEFQLFFVRS